MKTMKTMTVARIAILLAALCALAGPINANASGSEVRLHPAFDPEILSYTATVPHDMTEVVMDLSAEHPKATVTVNGKAPDTPVQLAVGRNSITIRVAAEDARYTRAYSVIVTREGPPPSNAELAGLTVEAGADGSFAALDIGAFDADTTDYAVTVPNGTTHARLTATAANAKSGLKSGAAANLSAVTGGAAGPAIALREGPNALSVEVTAEDGTSTKTYTVTVTREASQAGPRLTASFGGRPYEHDGATAFRFVVNLSEALGNGAGKVSAASFEVTNGRVDSVREIKSDFYYVHVRPDGREDVTVTLRGGRDCAEAGAVCAGDGRKLWNSPSMTLTGPPNADLSGLTAEAGADGSYSALDIGAFDADTTSYSASVPYETTHARLTATAADAAASLSGGGEIALDVGANALTVKVTAEDGTTKKTYTVTVTREARVLSSNADLSGLEAEAGLDGSYAALDIGGFSAGTTAYSATVPHGTTHARLSATAAHADASLEGGGAVALDVGANALTVEVTAEDGTTKTYSVTVTREAAPKPLTASFGNVPATHDGETVFTIDVRFSESLGNGSAPTAASFDVAFGTAKAVESVEAGLYRVSVKPKSHRDARVTLAGGRDCSAAGAVCTADGRPLENSSTATVGGPVRIRIEGGVAKEGKDATLDFALSLDRAAAHAISVDFATADRTATAGVDYEAASGTLTFAPGETAATVTVAILDDEVDEGKETFELHLSNAHGAYLRNTHTKATGTIRNTDAMPQAWLTRFGRGASDQTVQAITRRFDGDGQRQSHLTVGGRQLNRLWESRDGDSIANTGTTFAPAMGLMPSGQGIAQDFGQNMGMHPPMGIGGMGRNQGIDREWRPGQGMDGSADYGTGMGQAGSGPSMGNSPMANSPRRLPNLRDLLRGASFYHADAVDEGVLGGLNQWTAWGETAHTRFGGVENGLDIDGEITSGIMGVDGRWNNLLGGIALSHAEGSGAFRGAEGSGGEVQSRLTSVSPYLHYDVNERTSLWGMLGYGRGSLDLLSKASDIPLTTGMTNAMAAFGGRGVIGASIGDRGRFSLAVRSDAMFTHTASDAVTGSPAGNLAAANGSTRRIRILLEGDGSIPAFGGELGSKIEAGLRHDGGDAETGAGFELGGSLSWVSGPLSLQVNGRRLLAHRDGNYREQGYGYSITYQPGANRRGVSLRIGSAWGAAQSGVQQLWASETARGFSHPAGMAGGRRFQMEFGFGLLQGAREDEDGNATGGRLWYPYLAADAAGENGSAFRLGLKLTESQRFEVGIEAGRREFAPGQPPEDAVLLQGNWRF